MSQDCARAVIETVQVIYGYLFPNLTSDQMMDKLRRSGLHHHLLEIAIPEADDAEGDEYGEFLDSFEGDLAAGIEHTYELLRQERRKRKKRRR